MSNFKYSGRQGTLALISKQWPELTWKDKSAPYFPAFRQYLISKSTTKTVQGPPQTTRTGTPINTNTSGSTQQHNAPAESQFPFEIYLDRKGYDMTTEETHWAGGVQGYDTKQWGDSGSYDPLSYLQTGYCGPNHHGRGARGVDLVFRRSDGEREAARPTSGPPSRC